MKSYSDAEKEKILLAFKKSKMSQNGFSKTTGIPNSTLKSWLKKETKRSPKIEIPKILDDKQNQISSSLALSSVAHLQGWECPKCGSVMSPMQPCCVMEITC